MDSYREYIQKEFNQKVINKLRTVIVADYNDSSDIIQDAILNVLQKPEDFITDLYNRGKLKTYILNTIYQTTKFYNSKFNKAKRFERGMVKISDPDVNQDKIFAAIDKIHHVQLEPDQQAEVIETSVINAAADLGEYELTILELYTQMGTVRAVAQQTGINYTNIHRTLKFCKTVIKQKIQKNAFI